LARTKGRETNDIFERGEGTESKEHDYKNEQGEEKHEERRWEIRTGIVTTNQTFNEYSSFIK